MSEKHPTKPPQPNHPPYLWILQGVLFLIVIFLYGCYKNFPNDEQRYQFYYVNDYHSTGTSLSSVPRFLPQSQEEIHWTTLLDAHMNFAQEEDICSPFPSGTTLLATNETIPTVADVYFSSEYGELIGIDKTMADFAVVETLCQLEQVTAVRIFIQGQEEEPPLLSGELSQEWEEFQEHR